MLDVVATAVLKKPSCNPVPPAALAFLATPKHPKLRVTTMTWEGAIWVCPSSWFPGMGREFRGYSVVTTFSPQEFCLVCVPLICQGLL